MKALPIETILGNIGRFNHKIELKPGQIFSGKVLAIYPNDMAQVQLAGRKLNAQLLTGLSLGENYWFEVKPSKRGSVPLLSVMNGLKGNQAPPGKVLGVKKMHPELRLLVDNLVREQLPMTKEFIQKAENWLSQVPSIDKGIQAVKTMMFKNLPETNSIFKALYHAQDATPMTTELDRLKQLLTSQTDIRGKSAYNHIDSALNRVMEGFKTQSALNTVKQLYMHYQQSSDTTTKNQIHDIFKALGLIIPKQQSGSQTSANSQASVPTDKQILQQLSLKMAPEKAEVLLQNRLNQLDAVQSNAIKGITQHVEQKPQLQLIEMVRGLGLTLERDLLQNQIGELQKNPQLKGALAELLNQELPAAIREKAEGLMHRITGQQLLHTNESQSLMTLFYQIPVHFKEWKSDLMMKWDLKQNPAGEIDEDYSRILFYLDLQYLKETVIDMNVQNRIVTIKIINDHMFVNQLVPKFKELLKERLEEFDYKLSSVKVEQSSVKNKTIFDKNMMEGSLQGVDFTV